MSGPSRLDQLRGMARGLISLSSRFEPFVPGYRPTLAETMQLLGTLERWTRQSLAPLLPPEPGTSAAPSAPLAESAKVRTQGTPSAAAPAPTYAGVGASAVRQGAGTPIGDPLLSRYSSTRVEHQGTVRNPSLVQALLSLQSRRGPRAAGRADLIQSAAVPGSNRATATSAPAAVSPRFASSDFMVEDPPLIDVVVPKRGHGVRSPAATHSILRAASGAADGPGHEPTRGNP